MTKKDETEEPTLKKTSGKKPEPKEKNCAFCGRVGEHAEACIYE